MLLVRSSLPFDQTVRTALLEVGTMLAAAEDPVQVARVVARPMVASTPRLDEEALVLAVLLALVVLLAVLHQPALPLERGLRSGALDVGLRRRLRRRGVQLLHDCLLYTSPSPRDS